MQLLFWHQFIFSDIWEPFFALHKSSPATAFWVNYRSGRSPVGLVRPGQESRLPRRDAVRGGVRVNSGGALGGDAPEALRPSSTLPPGSVRPTEVLLHTESPVRQTQRQWSTIYLTSTGFYVCAEITQLTAEFSFSGTFLKDAKKRNIFLNTVKDLCGAQFS